MKEKFASLFKWGTDAVTLVMANNIVISALMLITGVSHLINPERALFWDSVTLSLLLLVYAVISIIFILTHNKKIADGQELAGNLIKGYYNKQQEQAAARDEIFQKSKVAQDFTQHSNERLNTLTETIVQKHQKIESMNKGFMLSFYVMILATSIFLLIRSDIAILISYIIIGVVLIVNGVMSIISATSARKEHKFKFYFFSVLLSLGSILLGVYFVVFSQESSIVSMRVVSILFIIKAVGDFIVAFRNKNIKSSITDTITQIKQQKVTETAKKAPVEGAEKQSDAQATTPDKE